MHITFSGNKMELIGSQLKVGETAPDFKAVDKDLGEFELYKIKSKHKILSILPSIDTVVCMACTKKFEKYATEIKDASIITISMDLPFAQARFAKEAEINKTHLVSDYKFHEVAQKYGLLIKELGLLTRAVIILDENNKIIYTEYVSEITNEPNYVNALNALK